MTGVQYTFAAYELQPRSDFEHLAMSSLLLSLPRELRDDILAVVVSFQIEHPTNTQRAQGGEGSWLDLGNQNRVFQSEAPESYISPSRSIFMVNKQLRSEAIDAVTRCQLVNTLDIAIIDGNAWFWPSWKRIFPRFSLELDRLDVNILLAHDVNYEGSDPYPSAFTIWGFLSRVLKIGPRNPFDTEGKTDLDIRIKELCFNLRTAKHIKRPAMYSERDIPIRAVKNMAHLDHTQLEPFDPRETKDWLENHIEQFKHLNIYDTKAAAGTRDAALMERVKKFVICLDGEVQHTYETYALTGVRPSDLIYWGAIYRKQ